MLFGQRDEELAKIYRQAEQEHGISIPTKRADEKCTHAWDRLKLSNSIFPRHGAKESSLDDLLTSSPQRRGSF